MIEFYLRNKFCYKNNIKYKMTLIKIKTMKVKVFYKMIDYKMIQKFHKKLMNFKIKINKF